VEEIKILLAMLAVGARGGFLLTFRRKRQSAQNVQSTQVSGTPRRGEGVKFFLQPGGKCLESAFSCSAGLGGNDRIVSSPGISTGGKQAIVPWFVGVLQTAMEP